MRTLIIIAIFATIYVSIHVNNIPLNVLLAGVFVYLGAMYLKKYGK